ncbi:MAG: RHS repeat-associated core domain-containing protein [Patescibacteria group bacterium]|nr:RHS repeat-associated core domain-containing protein [Patescibacteria group bacterium]
MPRPGKGDITDIDGSVVARQYTARDQLAQIDYNSGMVATFAYDDGSRRTSRVLGDTPGTQTAWTYGRQDNLPTAINSGIPGASFTFTYDANKNKLTEGISTPMANFGFNSTAYDPADRLTAWNRTDGNLDQAWNLSLVGNWATFTQNQVQQTRSHTAVHEIAAIDASPIAHDPTGNLARNAGDTLDRFSWDFDNRLASADTNQDGTPDCLYRHDALGRRVSKTVPDGEGSATMVFVGTIQALDHSPHAMQVVAEYVADSVPASPERKFVYATYIDEPVMMVDETALGSTGAGSEEAYYYHQNSLYSVASITDASGAVVERYAYSAYGKPFFLDSAANPLDPQASTIGNPYLFTGRRLDEETGLYCYRARMYDPELGRFVSRDPIGYAAGDVSLYRYVGSAPLSSNDPGGLVAISCRCKYVRYMGFQSSTSYGSVVVNCNGAAAACCASACTSDDMMVVPSWTGEWDVYGASPSDIPSFVECWTDCSEADCKNGCWDVAVYSSAVCLLIGKKWPPAGAACAEGVVAYTAACFLNCERCKHP